MLGKKRIELPAPQLLLKNNPTLPIFPVNLENRLGEVKPDRGSIHLDGSYSWLTNHINDQFGTSMPSGAVHPSIASEATQSKPLAQGHWIVSSLRSSQ
jgi:hypothetical protein